MRRFEKYSILIADDDRSTREYIKFHLEKAGYCVITAEDGLDGIEKLKVQPVDLIISDIMMPEMDGFEFQKTILEDPAKKHIPFIFLTAKSEDEDQIKGLETGVREYITKPFNPKLLVARVQNILRSSGDEKHLREKYEEMKIDLETASETQAHFLPARLQVCREVCFDYLYLPFFSISGDIFDFINASDDEIIFYVGDISGHGTKTGLLMTAAKTYIDTLVRKEKIQEPHKIIQNLNKEMLKFFGGHHMSCIFSLIDLRTNRIRLYNAGHPSPFGVFGSGSIEQIPDAGGIPVGWMPDFNYLPDDEVEIELHDGDMILFFTDGLFDCENSNSQMLGYNRLGAALGKDFGTIPFENICSAAKRRIENAGYKRFTDDCTIVAIKKIG